MNVWFPRHLLYKEWRQQRAWILLATAVTMCLPVFWLVSAILDAANAQPWAVHSQFDNLSLSMHHDLNLSQVLPLLPIVAVGLAVASLSLERSSGGLLYTMTGPVSRRELLRTKFFVGWGALMAIFLLYAVFSILEWLIFGLQGPSLGAIAWFLFLMVVQSAVFAIAFTISTAVGNILVAAIVTFGVIATPAVLYKLIEAVTSYSWADRIHGLEGLSPLSYAFNPPIRFNGVSDALWFLIVAVAAYRIAQHLFSTSDAENYANFFIFAVLWKWSGALLCAVVGLISGAFFRMQGAPFLVFGAMAAFVYWILATRAIRYYHRARNT